MPFAPLPIDLALEEIRAAVQRHRAVVVVAEPGAGKTTRVPPALLDAGPAILLQPRRAAARAIARRIAEERGWTLGEEVGWQVRFDRNYSRDSRLLVATEGVLTARLQKDPFLTDFATIVLDEFHERSIHADLAIALSKQALLARDDLRVVVMSATLDADRVASYLWNCPVVRVPGTTHRLTLDYVPRQHVVDATRRALAETPGDALFFQPGAAEIGRTIAELRPALGGDVDLVPLHGGLSASEQDYALQPSTSRRRIVVCTNIAETSLTVPRVTAVIDSGFEKVARYDAVRAIDSLTLERASQAAVDQRAGRAGRLGPGLALRLWDRTDRLKPFREPDIHRVDLAGVALDILGWGGDPRQLDWFDAPRPRDLAAALELLECLGATDEGRITRVGEAMLRLSLPPRLARIVVEAGGHQRAVRAATLIAERTPRLATKESTSNDLLPWLDRWHELPEHLRETAAQLERLASKALGLPPTLDLPDRELRRAIFAGYPDRLAQRRDREGYRYLLATGTGAMLAPESTVRDAEYLVALDVQAPTGSAGAESRIRLASEVDRAWLAPTAVEREHLIDESGRVRAKEVARYDAICLAEHPIAPDPSTSAEMLSAAWLRQPRDARDEQLVRRLAFAGVPRDVASLARSAALGARTLKDVDILGVLDLDARLALDRHAPEFLQVPSGRQVRLDYGDDGTVTASVKLQELFGLAETPRLGPGREPVLFALLAPSGRPVQLTRDLRSFWSRTYPEVRKELRGRYPRHPWPEDPWNAPATHRTKPRG